MKIRNNTHRYTNRETWRKNSSSMMLSETGPLGKEYT